MLFGWQFFGVVYQGFQIVVDYGQGGVYFVGYVVDEVVLYLFKLIQVGDIFGDNQLVVVVKQIDLDLQVNVRFGWGMDFQWFLVVVGIEVGFE